MTGERKRTLLRYLGRLREVAMSQATGIYIILNISNIETIADSRGSGKDPSEQNPADSLACSRLRARLRLEQRLLRFKDRNGF